MCMLASARQIHGGGLIVVMIDETLRYQEAHVPSICTDAGGRRVHT